LGSLWTDLALLRIERRGCEAATVLKSAAEFGDQREAFSGQTVFAVRNPHGLTRTVTCGIIFEQ